MHSGGFPVTKNKQKKTRDGADVVKCVDFGVGDFAASTDIT
jgi:hypothetical protein